MSDSTCGGNETSVPRGTCESMIQSTVLWFPCDVWLRNRAVHTISSYVIQMSFPNSPIVKHYHVRFRSATLRYRTWPPRVLSPKIFHQNSVTWVQLSKFNVHIMCCFLLCLRIHDLVPRTWTKKS